MTYTYEYPRASNTVDIIVFNYNTGTLKKEILIIKRKNEPFKGMYSLPGGFVNIDETLISAAKRELFEETNICVGSLHLVGVYDEVERDPRGRVIATAFFGHVTEEEAKRVQAKDDAAYAAFKPLDQILEEDLAFDHRKIIQDANKKSYYPVSYLR